jgi:ankyrin repeat protein
MPPPKVDMTQEDAAKMLRNMAAGTSQKHIIDSWIKNYPESVNTPDPRNGECAIHIAAKNKNIAMVEVLLENKADINARCARGITPLMWIACENGSVTLSWMIDHGADIHAQSHDGRTALLWAARHGAAAAMDTLIHYGADMRHTCKKGYSILDYTLFYDHAKSLNCLLKHGILAEADDQEIKKHLDRAKAFGSEKTAHILDSLYQKKLAETAEAAFQREMHIIRHGLSHPITVQKPFTLKKPKL